ncbi:MAG: type II toxin-antitoxin system Phd/YefM family antitoxin [Sphingobacteriaceae bacterium]|nr:type II toxin-antitoxin system Phd/YefM family antitoxin [Cytophagaceae bacterium]
MAIVTAQDARKQFSDILNTAAFQKEAVIITRQGKKLAAVISFEELEYYKKLEDYFDALEA